MCLIAGIGPEEDALHAAVHDEMYAFHDGTQMPDFLVKIKQLFDIKHQIPDSKYQINSNFQ